MIRLHVGLSLPWHRVGPWLALAGISLGSLTTARINAVEAAERPPAEAPGFFEAGQPFYQSSLSLPAHSGNEAAPPDVIVRGILIPLPGGVVAAFDQELLRIAGVWQVPAGQPPVTLATMAQVSYADPFTRATFALPVPTGELWLANAAFVGAGSSREQVQRDPRPQYGVREAGRGPLPEAVGRFSGIEVVGSVARLHYRVATATVGEWYDFDPVNKRFLRHLEIESSDEPLLLSLGRVREGQALRLSCNDGEVLLSEDAGTWIATIPARTGLRRVTFAWSPVADPVTTPTPRLGPSIERRWSATVRSPILARHTEVNGFLLDRISLPEGNPWQRRVRPADLAFVSADRAAVVTYDGDVWWVDGLATSEAREVTWTRHAAGLHEPLSIAALSGVLQVATKNGVVRLHDRDGDGEADWLENFSDLVIQSQSSRAFALDMAVGPDGSTYVSQGGIPSPITPHAGAILRISPDGRSVYVLATGTREAFVAVHPVRGWVTGTDQQGNFIPSSPVYWFRPGDHYGFREEHPRRLDRPLAWIPHEADSSSASQEWVRGAGLAPLDGQLLHLSHSTGRLFLVSPDLDAPRPQAAVLPLGVETKLPLLHARSHPLGDALFLVGFQIYGARMTTLEGMLRLRRSAAPFATAVAARSYRDGVVLSFAHELDPASLEGAAASARLWNYHRSQAYGSGRYRLDGSAGNDPWPVGRARLSRDKRSVFVHLPDLPAVDQLEVAYLFRLRSGEVARGTAYFSINEPRARDDLGGDFDLTDLADDVPVVREIGNAVVTAEEGRRLTEAFGCAACHSADGSTEGKVGPTWKGLFGAMRPDHTGVTARIDEEYLRQRILYPGRLRAPSLAVEMPSYAGVLGAEQLEAIVLYLKTLGAGRSPP